MLITVTDNVINILSLDEFIVSENSTTEPISVRKATGCGESSESSIILSFVISVYRFQLISWKQPKNMLHGSLLNP